MSSKYRRLSLSQLLISRYYRLSHNIFLYIVIVFQLWISQSMDNSKLWISENGFLVSYCDFLRFLNWQQMGKVIRNFCWHKNFVTKRLSVPALGLYTCINSFKMCLKSYFKDIVLKLATNGQSNKGFLLTSTFVPKGLSALLWGYIHV